MDCYGLRLLSLGLAPNDTIVPLRKRAECQLDPGRLPALARIGRPEMGHRPWRMDEGICAWGMERHEHEQLSMLHGATGMGVS